MPYKDLKKRRETNYLYKKKWLSIPGNKEKANKSTKLQRKKKLNWLDKYRKTLKCTYCPFSFKKYPECCEFHHVNRDRKTMKTRSFSSLLQFYGYKKFFKEIKKCIPLCANCHRIQTKKELNQKYEECARRPKSNIC
jgi:hypothetical protein